MKPITALLFCFIFSHALLANGGPDAKEAQDTARYKTAASPDFPGSLQVSLGFNFLQDAPEQMDLGFWGSKSVSIYYLYSIRLGDSRFSFNPGFGVGLEKYSFDNDVSLSNVPDSAQIQIMPIDGLGEIKKSKLAANYIDIPLELRFHLNKDNFKKSFKIAVGGKIGMRFSSHTKIKFEEDSENKIIKDKESFDLNRFRYGVHGRIGIGGFSLFYYQELSELFKDGKGPEATSATPFKAGLALDIF